MPSMWTLASGAAAGSRVSVWAIAMVRDEADVIEPVLRHVAAQGVEGILVLDNGSTDGTPEILSGIDLPCKLMVEDDEEVGYYQSRKMTILANDAYVYGAEWVWPFDADEIWYYGNDAKPLARVLEETTGDVLRARLWHHFATALDAPEGNPFQRMTYRAQEAPIGKVIVRWQPGCVLEAGNHDATFHGAKAHLAAPSMQRDVQIRHFPYRSEEQFVRKAINGSQAYAATDLPWTTGQHWREYGLLYERGGEEALRAAYRAHFYYDLPSASGLVYDPARLDS